MANRWGDSRKFQSQDAEKGWQNQPQTFLAYPVGCDSRDHGVSLALEPLNPIVDHHGYWLTRMSEAADIVQEVASPNLKILDDLYHALTLDRTNYRALDLLRRFGVFLENSAGEDARIFFDIRSNTREKYFQIKERFVATAQP